MSEEKDKETVPQPDQVKVEEDGKATITEEAAESALAKQEADPSVQTTSEPSDSPAAEHQEQLDGTAEGAGVAGTADAGTEVGAVEAAAPADEDAEKEAKRKAAEEARAARAAARAQRQAESPGSGESAEAPSGGDEDAEKEAKRKAAEEARAARAAARAQRQAESAGSGESAEAASGGDEDAEKEAKRKAAEEARAARAAARAKKEEEDAGPKEPSPNQPRLDRLVQLIKESVGEDAIEEAWINDKDRDLPVVNINAKRWLECAKLLRDHAELKLDYLSNVSGVDRETHMEVVYHLISLESKLNYCAKVKTDREKPSIPSVTPLWSTANWNEREIYDLLGIDFPGHPDLRRIMMPDDWVGHPLRKDYEPIDPEV